MLEVKESSDALKSAFQLTSGSELKFLPALLL